MTSNSFNFIRKRRPSRVPRLLIITAILLVVLVVWFAQAPLRSAFWQLMTPVVMVRNALGATEASSLRAEVAQLQARVADRDALYQENVALKETLNRAAGRNIILAGILQRPPLTPYDTFIIDAGQEEGVLVGSYVSLGGSALVGTVTEVHKSTAQVTLYSAPGSVHQALLMVGEESTPISIEGQGGGSLRAEVPAGTGAMEGDVVILPDVGMGLTAVVRHVERVSSESFETIYFSLPGNLNARFVEIWQ